MATKKRYINTKFWDDNYIITLDPIEKMLFLYFLTNPLTNITGIYEISLRRIAFDTGIEMGAVSNILKRFKKDKRIYYADGWLYIKNFVKNQVLNPSIIGGIKNEMKLIPQSVLLQFDTDCDRLLQTAGYPNINIKIKIKERTSSFKKREDGEKPYYNDLEVRDVKGKLWCIPKEGGQWLEFNGNKKDIIWK